MERRLATILAMDAVSFSSKMEEDDEGTLTALKHYRSVIDARIDSYAGRIFGSAGDSIIAEFASPVAAVRCAIDLQAELEEGATSLPLNRQMKFRAGVHIGDIMIDGDNLMGDGVNVASRIEQMAPAGGVCISNSVADLALDRVQPTFQFAGEVKLKNIQKRVGVWVWPEKQAASVKQRQQSRSAFVILGVGALIAFIVASTSFLLTSESGPSGDLPSIAVLPFDDRSPGPDQGYLSDAISEGIINELARFMPFRTIARNSSFSFRGKDADADEIRESLGAEYILEGSQQKIGEQLIVTAQLLNAETGEYIWTERFEGEVAQLFEFQSEIIRRVASTVGGKLAVYPGLTGDRETVSAMHLSTRALKYLRKAEYERARQLFEAAIEADPSSVHGYRGLGFYYRNVANHADSADSREEAVQQARKMAEKALELDPENYLTHYLLGHLHLLSGKVAQGQAKYEKTQELNPSFSNGFVGGASALIYLGETAEAIEDIKYGMRIDPLHPQWFNSQLAWAYWASGDCDAAIAAFLPMTRIPAVTQRTRAAVLSCKGDAEEAARAMEVYLDARPGASLANEHDRVQDLWSSTSQLERWLDDLRAAGMPE